LYLCTERKELWKAFSYGYTGQLLWAIAQWYVNPWNDPWYAGLNCCGVLYYPHGKGFLESTRLKVYTESLQDYEYLTILKERAEKYYTLYGESSLVSQAKNIYQDTELVEKIKTIDDLTEMRKRIASLIIQLDAERKIF